MKPYLIAPSLLSANWAKFGEEARCVLKAGADVIHIDIMDNHYVPNLTFGPHIAKALREDGIRVPLDIHLMVKPVDRLIDESTKTGANWITFHPETSDNVEKDLLAIKKGGCLAGLALNPTTPLTTIKPYLHKIDILLIMTVNPGFGGQAFIPEMLSKIQSARELIAKSGSAIQLSVDGGINEKNIQSVYTAGADLFVVGSAIFNQPNRKQAIDRLHMALSK